MERLSRLVNMARIIRVRILTVRERAYQSGTEGQNKFWSTELELGVEVSV